MRWKLRFVVAIAAAVGCMSVPLPGLGQDRAESSLRSETSLTGVFFDPLHAQPVLYDASTENGVLTLRLDLDAQSVTLRSGQGELHVSSSNNTAAGFSTLSDEEREILRHLATYLDQELKTRSVLDTSAICMIRNLGAWPPEMPLSVSVDSVSTTVGEISVPMEEIQQARREAMNELLALPGSEEGLPTEAYTSLCNQIGKTRRACYPTSLKPYKEKCESVLLGGTTCRGRCGTTCSGLCSKQRYTQDCHSHDRCADVYGIAHRYCNFIFPPTFDDCTFAPSCVDLPGVWTLNYHWDGTEPGISAFNIYPNKDFTTAHADTGTWKGTATSASLTFETGCKPVYTGTLSSNRQTMSGTMKCRTQSYSGTWSATKTNTILPAKTRSEANDPGAASDRRVGPSSPPDQ